MNNIKSFFIEKINEVRDLLNKTDDPPLQAECIRSLADTTTFIRHYSYKPAYIALDFAMSVGSRMIASALERGRYYKREETLKFVKEYLTLLTDSIDDEAKIKDLVCRYIAFAFTTTPPGIVALKNGKIEKFWGDIIP